MVQQPRLVIWEQQDRKAKQVQREQSVHKARTVIPAQQVHKAPRAQ